MNDFCLHNSKEIEIWLYNKQIFIKHLLGEIWLGDEVCMWIIWFFTKITRVFFGSEEQARVHGIEQPDTGKAKMKDEKVNIWRMIEIIREISTIVVNRKCINYLWFCNKFP